MNPRLHVPAPCSPSASGSWTPLETKPANAQTNSQVVLIQIQSVADPPERSTRAEGRLLTSCNAFCSRPVYSYTPACLSFMLISCYCPSSLNITLEFHLKGASRWVWELCMFNESDRGWDVLIVALMLFPVPVPLLILSLISNMTWFLLWSP